MLNIDGIMLINKHINKHYIIEQNKERLTLDNGVVINLFNSSNLEGSVKFPKETTNYPYGRQLSIKSVGVILPDGSYSDLIKITEPITNDGKNITLLTLKLEQVKYHDYYKIPETIKYKVKLLTITIYYSEYVKKNLNNIYKELKFGSI